MAPVVTGVSPAQGQPGTTVTIRGEHLAEDAADLQALIICGTDCVHTAQWKSPSKIIARVGQANRGAGDIVLVTKSGGRGTSNVQFRVFVEAVGPLTPSPVWVDETHTVPARNAARNVADVPTEARDALGLRARAAADKPSQSTLSKLFPDASGNLRMSNFSPAWYLAENHKSTSLEDLERGIAHLKREITREKQATNDTHKTNLSSLISCVDALDKLHFSLDADCESYGWPLTRAAKELLASGCATADGLFSDVLKRKDRADTTRNAMSLLTRFRFMFFLLDTIDENLQSGDYAAILNDYARAKALFTNSDAPLFKQILRLLEEKMVKFKELLREKLIDSPGTYEEQSRLIKCLKILDPASNPAWECITAYHCYLETVLWDCQRKYARLVSDDEHETTRELNKHEKLTHFVVIFITDLLNVLTEKLFNFWKLTQTYSDAADEHFLEQQESVNEMLTNTINVTSWLIWNALMPSALPEQIVAQYKSEFVEWRALDALDEQSRLALLLQALAAVRPAVKSLLEAQFSRHHVQPLIELCKTIRLKCIEILTAKASREVVALASQENWHMDIGVKQPKTTLPDHYERELIAITASLGQVLASNAYAGEEELFMRDNVRQVIVNRFIHMLACYKECCETLLRASTRRPQQLHAAAEDALSGHSGGGGGGEMHSRRLLMCICNLDYVLQYSLATVCRRFSDVGVKYADLILEQTKHKFLAYQRELLNLYLELKCLPLETLVASVSYEQLPDEDDVSTYVKETIMAVVFVKAELHLLMPQFSYSLVKSVAEKLIDSLHRRLAPIAASTRGDETATQIVADLTALESALQPYLSSSVREMLNSIRSPLTKRLDNTLFQSSIRYFQQSMSLAINGLKTDAINVAGNELDSSNI